MDWMQTISVVTAVASCITAGLSLFVAYRAARAAEESKRLQIDAENRQRNLDMWRAVNFRRIDDKESGEIRLEHIGTDPAEMVIAVWGADGMSEDEKDWENFAVVVPGEIITLRPPADEYETAWISWDDPPVEHRTGAIGGHSLRFDVRPPRR